MPRRTRYEIYLDILETVRRKGTCPITRLSYGAGLPVDRTKKVVELLLAQGLLREEDIGERRVYRITQRGGEFLAALRTVRKFVQ
ncbi:MAG: winged helix-turn-helix domain-containing protein [Candidatus Bathyarchaeota archaeon]|nr:winged helix-turn-helix domain-containing protein [Candidatus Bathyarchaeota archaeon]